MQPVSEPETASEPWERLHPLSPLLRAGRLLVVGLVLVAQATGLTQLGLLLVGGLALAVVGALYALVAWRIMGFRIDEHSVEVRSGVVFRSHRRVPLDRIESVDVARPLVARLLGLADVRIEAVTEGDSEVRLQYLAEARAWQLRARLVALLRGARDSGSGEGDEADAPPPPAELVMEATNGEVVLGYGVAPLAAWASAVVLATAVAALIDFAAAATIALMGAFGFVAILVSVAPRVDQLLEFRVLAESDGLRVERGLIRQLNQRVPVGRLQAIRVDQPLTWRPFGRARLILDIAGYRGRTGDSSTDVSMLVPIATTERIAEVIRRLPIGVEDLDQLRPTPPPQVARWRAPIRWQCYGVAWTPDHAVTTSGLLRRRTDVVPHAKLQSLRIAQGPWQRRLGLATVHLDTAGPRIAASAPYRGVAEAARLVERSRST